MGVANWASKDSIDSETEMSEWGPPLLSVIVTEVMVAVEVDEDEVHTVLPDEVFLTTYATAAMAVMASPCQLGTWAGKVGSVTLPTSENLNDLPC